MRLFSYLLFFWLALIFPSNAQEPPAPASDMEGCLYRTLTEPSSRREMGKFLNTILRQVSSEKFFALVDDLEDKVPIKTNQSFYEALVEHLPKILPWFSMYHKLKAIWHQQKTLAEQTETLLGDRKEIDGYVEIGTPGTYINGLKGFTNLTGPIYVVHDQQSSTDYLQAFSINPKTAFRPYHHFVSLNNYAPISEEQIPSLSVDLVTCYMGLHPIEPKDLELFIASLHRILKPGGNLILREHDAQDQSMKELAYTAHMVAHAITPNKSHAAGACHFQSLRFWISLLEKHGFKLEPGIGLLGHGGIAERGDPTLNTTLHFTKIATEPKNDSDRLQQLRASLRKEPNYQRDLTSTYLSLPHWHNVEITQGYGRFIDHTPFYEFPYWDVIKSYWDVFGKSWNVARQHKSFMQMIASPYTHINLFICASKTVKYTVRGLLSQLIQLTYAGKEPGTIRAIAKGSEPEIRELDPHIKIVQSYPNSDLKVIELPRHKEFTKIIKNLSATHIDILDVAGNQNIQFKVRYSKISGQDPLQALPNCQKLYAYDHPTETEYTYAALEVPVASMKDVIKALQARGVELIYIHDF